LAKTWRRKSNSSPQLRPPADVTSKPRSARRNPRLKAKDEVSGRVPARVSRRPEVHLGMIERLPRLYHRLRYWKWSRARYGITAITYA